MFSRLIFAFSILLCSLMLTGCPATVKVEITNLSKTDIAVIYDSGYESVISSGETKEEVYDYTCLSIRVGNHIYAYNPVRPPDTYFDVGAFSTTIYAIFTDSKEFKIYRKNGEESEIVFLEHGCDNKSS